MNKINIFNFKLGRLRKFVIFVSLALIAMRQVLIIGINYNTSSSVTKENLQPYFVSHLPNTRSKSAKFLFGEECLNFSYTSHFTTDFPEEDFGFLKTKEGKNYKKILFYYHKLIKNFWFGFGQKPFEAACCKEKRCFTTAKTDEIHIEDFDAVMIHFRGFKFKNLPKNRAKHQRYIFYEKEPPFYSSRNPGDYEGIFNWTMTYRRDSDIYVRYGEIHSKKDFSEKGLSSHFENTITPIEPLMKTKKKMAAWMSSGHCITPSKREVYVKKMQEYISIDIYGKCGILTCDIKKMNKCYEMIEENYKFYLAFENNHCRDYLTEKFFTLLKYNVIPVVRGSGDYASIAPPHSYIDVKDFKSPKDLSNYLIYLDKNDTAYMEYFKWKSNYIIFPASWFVQAISFCDLCERLHSDKEEKVHYDLREWFVEKAKCNKDL